MIVGSEPHRKTGRIQVELILSPSSLTAIGSRGYHTPIVETSISHICICICTYKRPVLLQRLLEELQNQITHGSFSISAVIVDNDAQESGLEAVRLAQKHSGLSFDYYVEPERNISLARNRAIEHARGEYIAFIDDDEFPHVIWLESAYRILKDSDAAGVLGPVKPHFDLAAPKWLIKSRLLERKAFPTGSILGDYHHTRTGNVLFRRSLFEDKENRFDSFYGRIGGGDAVFFKQMMEKGHTFIWCNEAVVYESVTPGRRKKSYYIKRAFTRGMAEAQVSPFASKNTFRSFIAILVYSLILPFTLLAGQHVFMRFLVKDCDHLAKILSYLGIRPIKERPY